MAVDVRSSSQTSVCQYKGAAMYGVTDALISHCAQGAIRQKRRAFAVFVGHSRTRIVEALRC